MKCQKCGNELREGAVFCPSCGEKIENAQDIPKEESPALEYIPIYTPNYKSSYDPDSMPKEIRVEIEEEVEHKSTKKTAAVLVLSVLIAGFVAALSWVNLRCLSDWTEKIKETSFLLVNAGLLVGTIISAIILICVIRKTEKSGYAETEEASEAIVSCEVKTDIMPSDNETEGETFEPIPETVIEEPIVQVPEPVLEKTEVLPETTEAKEENANPWFSSAQDL